jgi:hypothetical protein
MENELDHEKVQEAHFVHWFPVTLPATFRLRFDFWPLREPGLCIIFFACKGIEGADVLDESLNSRTGEYHQYHHGDINAYHLSYFRRKFPTERAFHTCNLRKSYGFHLVTQGADPIPTIADAEPPYAIELVKEEARVRFAINDLPLLDWTDDGQTYGPVHADGRIAFRQMAPLMAEYANLTVYGA